MKRSFEIEYGDKQRCRDELINQSKKHNINVKKILTLPGEQALCVKTFKKSYPKANIIGIERDEQIHRVITEEKGIDCLNCDIREYIHSQTIKSQHHDIVFLDYYSYLNLSVVRDLQAFIKNDNICHKGKEFILGITLSRNMRVKKDDSIDFMRENLYNGRRRLIDNNLDDVCNSVWSFLSSQRNNLEHLSLEYKHKYSAQKGSCEMYFMIFRIIK